MTGLERLRELAKTMQDTGYFYDSASIVYEIAAQIEREQADDHEIAEWVREHGGIELVKNRDEFATDMLAWFRRVSGIPEDENMVVDDAMSGIESRLMPPGMDWPRFEDGKQVKIGDMVELNEMVAKVCGVFISKRGYVLHGESGEKIGSDARFDYPNFARAKRPKQDPIGADGLPIKKGDGVSALVGGKYMRFTVLDVAPERFCGDAYVLCGYEGKQESTLFAPHELTHTKPEPHDSAERIAEDIKRMAEEWCSHPTLSEASEKAASSVGEATMGVALSNLSKRCRALAERERCE